MRLVLLISAAVMSSERGSGREEEAAELELGEEAVQLMRLLETKWDKHVLM